MQPSTTCGTPSDTRNTRTHNILSKSTDTGRACAFATLVVSDKLTPMELDTNNNAQGARLIRLHEYRNQIHLAQSVPTQSQLTLSKKSTVIETCFKESKISCTLNQCLYIMLLDLRIFASSHNITSRHFSKLIV